MNQFKAIKNLYGEESFFHFKNSHVCIVGLGGVGSWAFESLVRSGIGEITIVDMDEVCLGNINRQVQALHSNIGQSKVSTLKKRGLDINPECKIHDVFNFYTPTCRDEILNSNYDYIIDAIDSLTPKCDLLNTCFHKSLKVLSIGATGGLKVAKDFKILDLNKSRDDKLLFQVRKKLRQKYDFPRTNAPWGIKSLFTNTISDNKSEIEFSCEKVGAVCHVTAMFGLKAAELILEELA